MIKLINLKKVAFFINFFILPGCLFEKVDSSDISTSVIHQSYLFHCKISGTGIHNCTATATFNVKGPFGNSVKLSNDEKVFFDKVHLKETTLLCGLTQYSATFEGDMTTRKCFEFYSRENRVYKNCFDSPVSSIPQIQAGPNLSDLKSNLTKGLQNLLVMTGHFPAELSGHANYKLNVYDKDSHSEMISRTFFYTESFSIPQAQTDLNVPIPQKILTEFDKNLYELKKLSLTVTFFKTIACQEATEKAGCLLRVNSEHDSTID
jgi:hypothetical protein